MITFEIEGERRSMIQSLEVKGLNNKLSDTFKFREDLNVITGANGSGKTTLLKLVWYLISGHLGQIFPEIPFHHLLINAETFSLSLSRSESNKVTFSWEFIGEERQDQIMTIDSETGTINRRDLDKISELEKRIARTMKSSLFFPTFRRIEGGFSNVSEYIDTEVRRYQFNRIARGAPYRVAGMLQEAMSELSEIVSIEDHKFVASISTHDIVRLVEQKHSEISGEANKRHRNSSDEITQRIRGYSSKRGGTDTLDLQEAKLLLDNIQKRLEKVDREQEALFQPITVLSEYVNDFFKDYGIRITENITLGYDTEAISNAISSDKLSAGEKQMLSFLCYNAFSEETIIFIDEPELSLHVDWQRLLLPTLLKQGTGNQFFIATHSPFIYTAYPQNEIHLDADRGNSQGEVNANNESY